MGLAAQAVGSALLTCKKENKGFEQGFVLCMKAEHSNPIYMCAWLYYLLTLEMQRFMRMQPCVPRVLCVSTFPSLAGAPPCIRPLQASPWLTWRRLQP